MLGQLLELFKPSLTTLITHQFNFFYVINYNYTLTLKQQSHIISLLNSIVLATFGIIHNIYPITYQPLNLFVLDYFTSYLITDLVLGTIYYRQYMNMLEGYIHHIVYIGITYYARYNNIVSKYQDFFLLEIPTVILDLGSMNSNLRNNTLFGINMFIFRIVYHIYLTYYYIEDYNILFFSLLALTTHAYWFYNWIKKYGPSFAKTKKELTPVPPLPS